MSAQYFPNVEDLLTLLMAELPDGVYATDRADSDDTNKNSYSSAELRAHAQMLANLYANLKNINSDKFVSTVTLEGLTPWEKDLFASAQDSMLPFDIRKSNLLAKIRANGGISLPAIKNIIDGILAPLGLSYDILPYSGQSNGLFSGAWILDFTPLDLGTYLAEMDPLDGAGRDIGITPLDCSLDYAAAGLTADQLTSIQDTAYRYEVRIYGMADANTLSLLDIRLTEQEPARSDHVITNNAPLPFDPDFVDFGDGFGPIMDVIDFGDGSPAATYDVWDFGGA